MNKLKYSMLVLVVFSLSMILNTSFALGVHSADADLQPEWSPAGLPVDYDVTITNNGPDSIDEFRIYINPEYTDVSCEQEPGWLLAEFDIYVNDQIIKVCQYNTNSSNAIPDGGNENFEFTATVPDEGCNMEWRFETRDEETSAFGAWNVVFDSTSVDNRPPEIIKLVTGISQFEDGTLCPNGPEPNSDEECWITQDTIIDIWVREPNTSICSPPSLVDYCDISVLLDEGYPGERVIYDETWYAPECDVPALKAKGMSAAQISEQCGEVHATMQFEEDSIHDLTVTCYDHAGNMMTDTERFRVDDTPPTTEKFHDGPFFEDGESEWMDTLSRIRLEALDGGEICHIDMVETYYQNHWYQGEGEMYCEFAEFCDEWQPSSHEDEGWMTYIEPFSGGNESCHIIEYYSVDGLGNLEDVKWECTYVDKTIPEAWFGVDQPAEACDQNDSSGCDYWITDETDVNLFCKDMGPHPSNHVTLMYRTWFDGEPDVWSEWMTADTYDPNNENFEVMTSIRFGEDSVHKIEYYCYDAVEKTSETEEVIVRVDMTKPKITKEVIGPQDGLCPPTPNSNETCYVTEDTVITVGVIDPDPSGFGCNIDNVVCTYDVVWLGETVDVGRFTEPGMNISFEGDSEHTLTVTCWDELGNQVQDVETFSVDMEAPWTSKLIGEPFVEQAYPKGCDDWVDKSVCATGTACDVPYCSLAEYITSDTEITLEFEDEKVGVEKTYWRNHVIEDPEGWNVCGHPDMFCNQDSYARYIDENLNWTEYVGPFTKPETSCHVIEYYSVDKFGHEELINSNCLFVDNEAPNMTKVIGEPQYVDGNDLYINQQTPITLTCWDVDPHPVDHVEMFWRYRFNDDCAELPNTEWEEWDSVTGGNFDNPYLLEHTISFREDSCHELEYYCIDGLGNEITPHYTEIDIVDTQAPMTDYEIDGPTHIIGNATYVDLESYFELTAVDPDPHPSGVDETFYRVSLLTNNDFCYQELPCGEAEGFGDWNVYNESFNIPEESCHLVEFYSVDNVENEEAHNRLCVFADHTGPQIDMSFDGLQHGVSTEDGYVKWINLDTEVNVEVYDPEPHPAGVAMSEYRVTLLGSDDACDVDAVCQDTDGAGDWTEFDNPLEGLFKIGEESCHLIEVYSVDNVGKDNLYKDCVYVDDTAPDTNKTIGYPKSPMSEENKNLGAAFYPELDPQGENICDTHPEMCMDVTTMTPLDLACVDPDPHPSGAVDICFKVDFDNEDITDDYCEGDLTDEGYCCTEGPVNNFHFGEESWHKLDYYCVDNVGNAGEPDVEYFKVGGSAFEIHLNKKWNLVSVPFALMEDSMDEVFAGHENTVDSVWTYYDNQWFVYTPDGNPANDFLTTMEPGRGYWILTTDEDVLTIGGELFSQVVYPISIEVVDGWNLLGYLPRTDEEFPVNEDTGLPGYFGPEHNGLPVTCVFNSLSQGTVDSASVYGYWETNNPQFEDYQLRSPGLDAGAGYWVDAYNDGNYEPSTTCR